MSKWFFSPNGGLTSGNVKKWRFRPIAWSVAVAYLLLVGISTTFAQNEARESSADDSEASVDAILLEESTCPAENVVCPMKDGKSGPFATATCPMKKLLAADGVCHCGICGCHCPRPSDRSAMPCCDSPVCQTLCAMRQMTGPRVKERFRDACADVLARIPNRSSSMCKLGPAMRPGMSPVLPDGDEMLSKNETLSGNRAMLLSENKAFSGNRFCPKKSMNALLGVNVMVIVNFDPDAIAATQSANIGGDVEAEEDAE
ncbi:MAG: hypothetical protein PHE53_06895 [Thermoguttaceae bacterium]|nr:hypothetical protein [Thermoguttaceae bacterium]